MKTWFLFRFGIIGVASAITYFVMMFVLPSYFILTENRVFAYTWMATSMIFVMGLIVLKWQFERLPSEPKKAFDFKKFLQEETNPGKPPTLMESAVQSPGMKNETKEETEAKEEGKAPIPKNSVNMGNIVEGVLGRSLADAELDLDLEVPDGTELNVFGQKYKVRKGSLKIKPRKSKEQKLKEMFPHLKSRKRKA